MIEIEQLQQIANLMLLIGGVCFIAAALLYGLVYRPAQSKLKRLNKEMKEIREKLS